MAVFLLFFYHTACVFHPWSNFYVKNDILSPLLAYIFVWSTAHWYMSLFFLLAGASSYYALKKRSGNEYIKERFKRLIIPFIFGVLALIPPQSYLGLLNHSDYSQSFFAWFPSFFQLNTEDLDGFFLGGHTWGHLWFIFHLFIYSLAVLPLFLYFNRESGQIWIRQLAGMLTNPLVLFVLFPLLLVLFSKFPQIAGGNPLFYITFFIIGFILMSDSLLMEKIDSSRLILLILGIFPLTAFIILDGTQSWPSNMPEWAFNVTGEYRNAFVPWFFILALMAYGRRLLNFSNRFLRYFAEGAYPIYILHNTIIVIIAFFVVQWDISVVTKYIVILLMAFITTITTFDIFVKRTKTSRFLFGMKIIPKIKPEF